MTIRNVNRETLGKRVRETWVAWAKEQRSPKPAWLLSWEQLNEIDREVDRRIGETIAVDALQTAVDLCKQRAEAERQYNFALNGESYARPYDIAAEEIMNLVRSLTNERT